MKSTLIAVDLAKDVFELACANQAWSIIDRKRLNRLQFRRFMLSHPPVTVAMEACGSAHYWARECAAAGHTVRLLPAHYVRAYRRRNKTDRNDAAALVEAARNPEILPVSVKSVDQQAIQSLHRIREQWKTTRTARINALRGLLRELGIAIPVGARNAIRGAQDHLQALPGLLQHAVADLLEEIRVLEARMTAIEQRLAEHARSSESVQTLMSVPGIGLLTATALAAAAGNPGHFRNGRHLAAWLGLTPREFSSGHRRLLGGISKRGDGYVRMLLVHGARSVLNRAKQLDKGNRDLNRLQQWALQLDQRAGHNKATVALANKLARIAWAVWSQQSRFEARPA
jgi:transposase